MRKVFGYTLSILVGILLIGVIIVTGRAHQAKTLEDQTTAYHSQSVINASKAKVAAKVSATAEAKELRKIGKGKKLKYVALGDSLAAGYYTSAKDKSYQYLVKSYLTNMLGFKTTLDGLWQGGATIASLAIPNYQKIDDMDPDLVTIEFGTNEQDSTNDYYAYPDTFEQNLTTLVQDLKKTNSKVKIILLTSWSSTTYKKYDSKVEAVAKKYKLQVANIHKVWADKTDTVAAKGDDSWRGTGDGYHPNDKGNQEIAKIIEDQIDDLYVTKQ